MIAILITTYNRPVALARSLPQIARFGCDTLVIDDGSPTAKAAENADICHQFSNVKYFRLLENRGLACAINIGLSFLLADSKYEWLSYFQDDVDVHPKCLAIIGDLIRMNAAEIFTGHDAVEHPHHRQVRYGKILAKYKKSCAGLHIHARTKFWGGILPVPTYRLGAPMRNSNNGLRGIGSNADWWICKDAPGSAKKLKKDILCMPGLVRSFYWKGEDSNWNNQRKCGEEPPLWRN
jgi:glycosyltransferase involved in cell wall biosynthesis